MAPGSLSPVYLPDLAKCFAGDILIPSWEDLLDALLSHDTRRSDFAVEILSSERPKRVLSKFPPVFSTPSANSKTAFDTSTATVPPTSSLYAIDEIKSDALWLSTQTGLEELEALRLVVLEWQHRPESKLEEGLSDAELASLRDAVGADYLERQTRSQSGTCQRDDADFDTQNARHGRLLMRFLRQQVTVFRIHRELVEMSLLPAKLRISSAHVQSLVTETAQNEQSAPNQWPADPYIKALQSQLTTLRDRPEWSLQEPENFSVQDVSQTTSLQILVEILKTFALRTRSSATGISSADLLDWLQFMRSEDFFAPFTSELEEQRLVIENIQLSAALLTVTLFNPASSISSLTTVASPNSLLRPTEPTGFFLDPQAASEIHELMINQARCRNVHAGPAVLSWAVILQHIRFLCSRAKNARDNHFASRVVDGVAVFDAATGRRGSSGSTTSQHQGPIEDVWESITNGHPADSTEQSDPADQLLSLVVADCQVFEYIVFLTKQIPAPTTVSSAYELQTLQELVAVSFTSLGYTPESVSAQLALMSTLQVQPSGSILFDPSLEMLENSDLLEGFYDTAASRFPYETLPFLKFSRALARTNVFEEGTHYVEYRMKALTTFTQAADDNVDFTTIREDENANLVMLRSAISEVNLSKAQTLMLEYTTPGQEVNSIIPPQTEGQVISESFPRVIRWDHKFSGFAYLGKLLELYYLRIASTSLSGSESTEEVVSEVVSLAATLLHNILGNAAPRSIVTAQEHCVRVLDEFSAHLNTGNDFSAYVFEILEQELQSFRRRSTLTFDTKVLISCLDFAIVFTKIRPNQVWSTINRCSLFGRHTASGLMLPLISAVEIPQGNFDFLEKCTQLYRTLVKSAITRRPPDTSSGRRSGTEPSVIPSVIQRIQGPCILASTEIMFAIFQQIQEWSFTSREQFARVNKTIADSFSDILCFTFNFGDSIKSNVGVNSVFIEAATFLTTAFRPASMDDVQAKPIVRYLVAAGCGHERMTRQGAGEGNNVKSMLSLTILLIRFGLLQDLPLSSTDMHVFNVLPAIARILQFYPSCRSTCLTLIQSTITYVERYQPTSLLRQFGTTSCLGFVHLIKHIDQQSHSIKVRDEIWRLLSLLVKGTQQWVANLLLTGALPQDPRKQKGQDQSLKSLRGKTFLQTAIEELGDIVAMPPVVAISMLQFVSQAQSSWPWVTNDLKSSNDFFNKLVNYVTKSTSQNHDEVQLSLQNAIAIQVTELSTTHLHYSKVNQDQSAVKTFTPLLEWLAQNAITVSGYKASLHSNLRKNFSAKYSGLVVSTIRRTGLIERRYGLNFFYDVDFGDQLFVHDSHWNGGPSRASDQSFSAEFRRANANLSLVDSELALLQSLHHFCVEHCMLFAREREDQTLLARIVSQSLHANAESFSPEPIFESILQTRAELCLALLRQLLVAEAKGSSLSNLLEPAWIAMRAQNKSYGEAIVNRDLVYWRSMLSILIMIVNYHDKRVPKPTVLPGTNTSLIVLDPANVIFLEIATALVAEGFKTVVAALQEQQLNGSGTENEEEDLVGIRDVLLLLTLFQAILRLPLLAQFSNELSERLSSSGVISSSLLLYSWSHLLVKPDGGEQPNYADLSIQFLVSLSSLPLVAEELAVEGALNRLSTSKTTESLQRIRGGVSHVDQRPNCAPLYRIWAGGLLPLCLNLLHAVGGVIAAEISGFLNQFPNQLVRASSSFMIGPTTRKEGTDIVTFLKASESSTLALISHILASYREAGASAAVEPTAISALVGYDEHRKAIIEDLSNNLALKPAERQGLTVATNERELEWQKSTKGDMLDAKIVKENRIALAALRREEDFDEK
ncbi:hypothetical protein LTR84_010239 [Exophiala bonariae]|uniref:Nucleoporin n=1 Tax=Exophiala bonariae TaxID=1690606 RepID=A0AAV9MUE8_9EURO|nr:hypothetical protein LTR84_010239 [Exophiala bonariae]